MTTTPPLSSPPISPSPPQPSTSFATGHYHTGICGTPRQVLWRVGIAMDLGLGRMKVGQRAIIGHIALTLW